MGNNHQNISSYYKNLLVAIDKVEPFYLSLPPFNPHSSYPEYIFDAGTRFGPNPAYEAVRNCFHLLGLDEENFGTSKWNPLQEVIKPGNKVVIKPNFVRSSHMEGGNIFSIITHPSIIRAVVDYVYKALSGEGEIIIADAPQMDCNFCELLEKTNLPSIQELYWTNKKFDLKIFDLRDFWLDRRPDDIAAYAKRRRKLPGDPLGSTVINLGKRSAFYGVNNFDKFYGADYNRDETIRHHRGETQEYMVSRTILSADVLVSVPKLKVHKKVGVTLNSKGLVGINTNKNYLVHYTLGTPEDGGDQFPPNLLSSKERMTIKTQRFLYDLLLSKKNPILDTLYSGIFKSYSKLLKPTIGSKILFDAGNWHGNDTAWRMVSDLVKIIIYSDKSGELKSTPQRKVFSLVDGIIGGENNGPLTPDEKKAGVVLTGFNPLAVDIVGTRLMGFDWRKLPWIIDLINSADFPLFVKNPTNIQIASTISEYLDLMMTTTNRLNFKPHPGWRRHVELRQK